MHNSDIAPDFPKENRIIFDWLSFTTRKHSVVELIELLELRECPFETVRGSKGFMWRQYYNGISIHYNENELNHSGDFIWLEMSGQGCRSFESFGSGDYESLFDLVRRDPENIHLTRIDIAFDDMTGVFDIKQICDEVRFEHFVSRTSTYQSIYSNSGNAVYFGSKKSNVFIRIYDKAAERGYDGEKFHWVRCELQLKDVNAKGFVDKLQDNDLRELYLGVLKNYISFRIPTNDSNKRRWPQAEWWSKFLDNAVRISVWSKPGVDYNLSACERYVMTQPIGSIKTLVEIFGKEAFFEMIRKAPAPKNPKYKQLIASVFAANKLSSEETTTDKFIELTSEFELELLAEIKDEYSEIKRMRKIKNLERGREVMLSKVKRELEAARKNLSNIID